MRFVCEKTLDIYRKGGLCEYCHKPCRAREPNHLIGRGFGGGFRLDVHCNLIALGQTVTWQCRCHMLFHHCGISQGEMAAVIAVRERVTSHDLMRVLWWIEALDKHSSRGRIERLLGELDEPCKALAERVLKEMGKW